VAVRNGDFPGGPMIGRIGSVALALALVGCSENGARADGGRWVGGCYAGWTAKSYPPSAVDYASLSQVMMFSLQPRADGTLDTTMFIDAVNGPLVAQELAARAHAAGKIAVLVVGGEVTQRGFEGATSAMNMDTFVSNLLATAAAWGYDGIDIDWEPISSADYAPM